MLLGCNLKLRAFSPSDAERVAFLVGDRSVSKWTSNIPFPYTKQNALDWIESTSQSEERNPFAVELNGELVACVSFWPHESESVEVGYWVGKSCWGRGICSEALAKLLSSSSFPQGASVVAKVMASNVGSERVLQKNGFLFCEQGTIYKKGREIDAKFFVRASAT